MQIIKLTALFFLVILVSTSWAKNKWYPELGITFTNNDLSLFNDFQDYIIEDEYDFREYKVVDKYSPLPSLHLRVVNKTKEMSFGLFWEYNTTGGRINYKDYSGEHSIDQVINQNQLGIILEDKLTKQSSEKLKLFFQLSASYAVLKLINNIDIYNVDSAEHKDYFNSWGVIGGIGLSYQLVEKPFSLKLEMGGKLSYAQPFHLDSRVDYCLRVDGRKLVPNWSGLHLGLIFGFDLFKIK